MSERKKIIDILIAVMTFAMGVVSALALWRIGYQAGFNEAKNLAENSIAGEMFRTPDVINTLSGTVTAISGNSVTLHTVSNNPFDTSPSERTVLVASSTKIIRFTQKDPKVFQNEITAYIKASQSGSTSKSTEPLAPPAFATPVVTDLASIKMGSTLSVTSTSNIKLPREFTADEIQIQLLALPAR